MLRIIGSGGYGILCHRGERADRARSVNIADGDPVRRAIFAQQGDKERGAQGITAEVFEEVVLNRDAFRARENIGHGTGQCCLKRRGGRHQIPRRRGVAQRHRRQGRTVKLAADGRRQFRQRGDAARDHVAGYCAGELRPQVVEIEHLGTLRRHDISDQFGHAAGILQPRRRLAHAGQRGEARLDLAQFDAVAADLDLRVDAAVVEEVAVRLAVNEIAGPVDPPAHGVVDELLGGQVFAVAIAARDTSAAHAQLALLAFADRLERIIEHIGCHARHRAADRDRAARHDIAAQARHGAFGRAITVDHAATLGPAVGNVARQGFAAHVKQPQFGQRRFRIAATAAAQQGRRGAKYRGTLAVQPGDDIGAEPRGLIVHHHERRA